MQVDNIEAAAATYRQNLGDGLILRWSTVEDTENIAELSGRVFRGKESDGLNEEVMRWVRRLMRGDHPLMGQNDYGVIEDTTKEGNPLVASMCLLRQTWEYEGIACPIGRPEIVVADPTYRKRGLIRSLMQLLHARSAAEGHLLQAITGIHHFYRQFGYEYALDLGGSRTTYLAAIPQKKAGAVEAYSLRNMTIEDLPRLQKLYNNNRRGNMVWTQIPEGYLSYQLQNWQNNPVRGPQSPFQAIVDTHGEVKGAILLAESRWGRVLDLFGLEVLPGTNLLAILPAMLRALQDYAAHMPTLKPDAEPVDAIRFQLGRAHPLYDALGELAPFEEKPYAWYVRIADIAAFLKHVAPVLERRLLGSAIEGYSGEIKIDFYRSGLRLVFAEGRLTAAEPWQKPIYEADPAAGCPPLIFIQLILGHRSLDTLRGAFEDVWANPEASLLFKTIFPARPSYVWPL